ncbi:MAG: hypothetical protein ACRDZ5_03120 [Acidimicrobiales bacterium]
MSLDSLPRQRSARFAHESERLFAGLLDFYDVDWEYEPVEFVLAWKPDGSPQRGFRPDFYLPEHDIFLELTTLRQDLVTVKNWKVRRLRELYPDVAVKVLYRRDIAELVEKYDLAPRWREAV